MSKSISSYALAFIILACFSFQARAVSGVSVSVPTASAPVVPVTVIPSTTQPVTVQSVPTTPTSQPSGYDFVPVTPINTVPSTSVNLNKYSNTVSPQASAMPAPVPRSYVLYMSGTVREPLASSMVLNLNRGPGAVIGTECMRGFRACVQTSTLAIIDASCRIHNVSLLPTIFNNIPVAGNSNSGGYSIWFTASALKEDNNCGTRPSDSRMEMVFSFVVNCVPADQVGPMGSGLGTTSLCASPTP